MNWKKVLLLPLMFVLGVVYILGGLFYLWGDVVRGLSELTLDTIDNIESWYGGLK